MRYLTTLLAALILPGSVAVADDDHEAARRLRDEGRIVPLESILKEVRSRYGDATLLEVELEKENGAVVYEVELLDTGGRVRELLFDARTGQFIAHEDEAGRRPD